jgi:hypothetical protein
MKRRKVKVYAPGYKKGGQSFEPHMMFDPKGKKANTMQDHLDMKKKGFLHKDEMKKAFTKKLQVGGTSTALQNQNIDEYGSDRLNMFKTYMSNNAVNRITQEEGNAFADAVMQPRMQHGGIPMMFAGGEDKVIDDLQQIKNAYGDVTIGASGNAIDQYGNVVARNIRPEFHNTGKYFLGADATTFSSSAGTPSMLRNGEFMPIGAMTKEQYGGVQTFNTGGFNGVNQANLATMQQYADMYKGQQTGFKDALGEMQGSINMLTKSYDPQKIVKSKTKISKDYKPAWKQAVKDWRKSGADESEFTFDPNNPYVNYDYNMEYGGTYMMDPQEASMYMEELPEFDKGGVTAIRKSIAEKLRKGVGTKDFTPEEKNRFSIDTADYGTKKNRYRGIKYDGIPLEKYVKVSRDIRSGSFNPKVDFVNITPPKQQKGIGPNAGEGQAPGRGQVTDAELKQEYSNLGTFDPLARVNAMNENLKKSGQLQTDATLSMADQELQQAEPPSRTPKRATNNILAEQAAEDQRRTEEEAIKAEKAKTTKKGTIKKEASDIVEEAEKGESKTVEEETDSEGNVRFDDEFPEETTVDDSNKDITSVTDPNYKIPGTNVPWNVQDTYLDMYKHRGKGLFRPEKTKMKFSHYANGLPAGQGSSDDLVQPDALSKRQSDKKMLDTLIAKETEGLDPKSARNVARNLRSAARDGQLDAYINSNNNLGGDDPSMTRSEMPGEGVEGTSFEDMNSMIRGNERPGTLQSIPIRTPEGMTEEQMNAQMRLDPANTVGPNSVGPNSGLDMSRYAPAVSDDYDEASFMADFEDAEGNLDMNALRKEGFKKKDIKAYLDAKKQFEDNVALTGDDAFAKGQLSRAAKEAFESKNNRGLSKEEIAARDQQAFEDEKVQRSRGKVAELRKQRVDRKAAYDAAKAADSELEAELIEERRIQQAEAERLDAEQRAADPNSGAPAYGSVRSFNQKPVITGNDPNYDYTATRGFDVNKPMQNFGGIPPTYNIGGPFVDSSDPNSSTYIENEDELAALIPEAENFDMTLPPPPAPAVNPQTKFADTTITEKDQYFGGANKFLAAMFPGAGAAAAAFGNKLTQEKLMPKLEQMTTADYNFTPDQNYADARGTIAVNPSGVSMPISAPVQFTGGAGAQFGGERGMSFQEGGTYMLSDREIQQVLAAGGQIEIL